ncbi:HlyD family type I secretion periplasmic adaptor subunit [Rhizobium rhizosphaerae]|uniref:HlyD family type I secretion periplasmic adaptor subunit n=1 Tax=Xaviernesmea rhizosphaerae TaxID=1672749 RepID=UPI00098F1997|nr:HlyD family type I secretion periplasmic adaptor subunit [Xaviernesmea rhizosphaerae]
MTTLPQRSATAQIIALPRREKGLASAERAFLPAALEIVETPASPTLRVTSGVICAIFVATLGWASIGKVDLIATAPGKVVPVGRTKEVQAFEAGTVRRILVDDGTPVKAGQPLILMDATLAGADRARFRDAAMRADLDIARLAALVTAPAPGIDPFAGVTAEPEAIEAARGRYSADRAGRDAKLAAADREIAARRLDAVSYEAEIARIDAQAPLAHERTTIRKKASDQAFGSRIDYLNAAQSEAELVNQRRVMLEKQKAAEAAMQAQLADLERLRAETERDWLADLQKAMRERSEAASELAKAERRNQWTSVVSPVDGTVADLSIHTEGGVVQAGEQLLKVVPSSDHLTIEAVIENQDIGFVHPGDLAEIKVDAFPYTRYGLLAGRVAHIARDADAGPDAARQHAVSSPRDAAATTEALRRSSALVYTARIDIDDPTLMIDGVKTRLEPGMAVTVEIKTGQRTVLDYLLSPISRHAHDALRER